MCDKYSGIDQALYNGGWKWNSLTCLRDPKRRQKIPAMSQKTAKKPSKTPVRARPQLGHQVRIIGGLWKRTPLPVLEAEGLRPTPDRVRETVFNWIGHLIDGAWERLHCLDLFAGTGALGFEAASRGVAAVTMVDVHTPVIKQLEIIKMKLGADQVHLVRADALTTAQAMAARGERFNLIFLDPPYHQDWLIRTLPLCERLLTEDGMIYAESEGSLAATEDMDFELEGAPVWLAPWEVVREGKAGIVFFHLLQRKKPA